MSRRRNKHAEEPENNERWLITYSDLITLLMIFFVIMYAMSKIDVAKFETLQQSLAAALHNSQQIPMKNLGTSGLVVPANPSDTGDKTQHPIPPSSTQQTQNDQALNNLYTQVKAYIQAHHLNGNVTILNQQRGVQITLRDVVLFDTGQATIRPQARQLLKGLVPFFQSLDNPIVIEGYTDNVPIDTPQFPSNWELSSARAINVVEYLVSAGISPPRLSGVGYGQYHPVAPNDTPAHRAMNRRINIVILRTVQNTQAASSTSTSNSAGKASSTGTSLPPGTAGVLGGINGITGAVGQTPSSSAGTIIIGNATIGGTLGSAGSAGNSSK